ncbi:MAG: hypothetical protein OXU25_00885 [Thaumarchaeota archaeon]|nr:hypothetical protein [Nitrososphaerota archaeon]
MSTALEEPRDAHKTYYLLRESVANLDLRHGLSARVADKTPGEGQPDTNRPDTLKLAALAQFVSLHVDMSEIFRLARAITPPSMPRVRLAPFVEFLRANGILPKAQEYSFEQQDILQKCAFIAQEGFGLNLGYSYHLHEYGTFSSSLAVDYHGLVDAGVRPGEAFMQRQFDEGGFVSLVAGKGTRWLSLASTMVHEMGSCEGDSLLDQVEGICADYDDGLAREALAALESTLPAWRERPVRGAVA